MSMPINHSNEQQAALAFSKQSGFFDELYSGNSIIQYKRDRVRKQVLQLLQPGAHILELNSGTGDDAIFFAQHGYSVHATDIAAGMQEKLEEKVMALKLGASVTNELCSYTALEGLNRKGPYDCIFSNFAGLNCTGELEKVLNSFDNLLGPGGIVVLVILPQFCLWETLLVFRGKFKTATRRFFSAEGRKAKIDGNEFTCWYYSPRVITKGLKTNFVHLQTEGLCTIVPPSYIENFAQKHPAIFSRLCKMEDRLKTKWPWKYIGDYYIVSLRKK